MSSHERSNPRSVPLRNAVWERLRAAEEGADGIAGGRTPLHLAADEGQRRSRGGHEEVAKVLRDAEECKVPRQEPRAPSRNSSGQIHDLAR